jgi:hypothetical protein
LLVILNIGFLNNMFEAKVKISSDWSLNKI